MNWQEKFFRARRLFRYRSKSQVKKYLLPNRLPDCCADEAGTSGICIEKGEVCIYLPADVPVEYLVKLVKGLA